MAGPVEVGRAVPDVGPTILGPPAPNVSSSYFDGPKPVTKKVKVRAHTRVVTAKSDAHTRVLPVTTATKRTVTPAVTPTLSTPSVRPAQVSTVKRFVPHREDEPVAGFTAGLRNPDGSWAVPGGKAIPGAYLAERPYYTDAYTTHNNAGPAGDAGTQWNAAQLAQAGAMQVANYGRPGYVFRSLIPGGLNEDPSGTGAAVARAANVGSMLLPGGGVGEAAGLFGLGLKALRGVRAGKLAEVAPEVAAAPEVASAVLAVPPVKGVVEPVAAATVRAAMPGAKIVRGKQEAGYSIERSKRVSAASVHLNNKSLPRDQRIALSKAELRGELPKIDFQGFKELSTESLGALQDYILDHPHLMLFQKHNASDALVNALAGRVPTRSEMILLEHIFGKNTADGISSIATHPLRNAILSGINLPRSLMASFDLSAPFRQGLMVATRHPVIFSRNLAPMVKAFGSERVYQAMIDEIHARPTYPMMLEARLPITELGRDIGAREERFQSDLAEKLTGGKYGPVRASGRAYTGFLDKTRADVFDHLIGRAQAQGKDVQDLKFLRSLGRYIGVATGRGPLGVFEPSAKVLNAFFFSPRLLASRLTVFNPVYYARLDPFVRKEALRSAIQLAGTLSVLLTLASRIPGAKVQTDPRNPDWGKIRVGNTRVDLAAGFQQELRLAAQLATGVAISSTTGKRLSLTAGGFGEPTRLDIAQRFFMGKESPIASLVTDWARGSTMIGEKFRWDKALIQRMIPLLAQDSFDLYRERHGGLDGLAAAFAGYGVGSFGIGMQTYGPALPTSSGPADYFSGSGGGGSDYFQSPPQSSSSGFGR